LQRTKDRRLSKAPGTEQSKGEVTSRVEHCIGEHPHVIAMTEDVIVVRERARLVRREGSWHTKGIMPGDQRFCIAVITRN
jgi:hypothetical protein